MYDGEWKDGLMEGKGNFIDHTDNSIFCGEMKNNRKHKGIMKQSNGNQYLGEFDTKEQFTGYSIMNFHNGNSYHGDFLNGIM